MKSKIVITSSLLISVCSPAFASVQEASDIIRELQQSRLGSSMVRQNPDLADAFLDMKGSQYPCFEGQKSTDLNVSAPDLGKSIWMPEQPGYNLFVSGIQEAEPKEDSSEAVKRRIHLNQAPLINNAVNSAQDAYIIYQGGVPSSEKRVFEYNGQKEGFVSFAKSETGKDRITLAFRGTQPLTDWLTNFNGLVKDSAQTIGLSEGSVHRGFNQRYMASREAIYALVNDVLKENNVNVNDVEFVVTGHSLGAALATVAAVDIKHHLALEADIKLVTSNSPRVFSTQAAAQAEADLGIKNMIRLWRENDPVSAVAPGFLGYKHVGMAFKLGSDSDAIIYNGKLVPNHGHKLNVRDANGNDVIHPLPHIGKRQKIANGFAAILDSANQGISRATNVVQEETSRTLRELGQTLSNGVNAVQNTASAAWGFVKSLNPFA